MSKQQKFRVTGEGVEGTVLSKSRFVDQVEYRLLELSDGRNLLVPNEALERQPDGSYRLTAPVEQLQKLHDEPRAEKSSVQAPPSNAVTRPSTAPRRDVTPDAGEILFENESVRVSRQEQESESIVSEPLVEETYDIERVSVNRIVPERVQPRHEGETLILPVYEEVLVVEKRLLLREEVRITRRRVERREVQRHTTRRDQVEVDDGNLFEGRNS